MAARAVLSPSPLSLIVFVNTAPFTGYCLPLYGLQQLGCHGYCSFLQVLTTQRYQIYIHKTCIV